MGEAIALDTVPAVRAARLPALGLVVLLVVLVHGVLVDAGWPARGAPRGPAAPAPGPVLVVAAPRAAAPAREPVAGEAARHGAVEPAAAAAPKSAAPSPRARPVRHAPALGPASPRAAATDWPTDPVRVPPSFEATYLARRGSLTGEATLRWHSDGASYTATLAAVLDGQRLFDWASRGALDEHGVAPERFVARGRRGQAAAANFQRSAGKITYAGPAIEHPLPPAAQDRLSTVVQVTGIVAATPERFAVPGAQIALFVSGARGDAEVWVFESRGLAPLRGGHADAADGTTAVHLVREATRPYDQRVELWVEPARPGAPLRMRFVTSGRETEALELDRLGP